MNNTFPILNQFNIDPESVRCERIGSGYINQTYKISGKNSFILQRINIAVFKRPEYIAHNIRTASAYLKKNYPAYPFLTSRPSVDGLDMVYDEEGFPWRLFPYIEDTITVDKVDTPEQAYEAARGFALLSGNLSGVDAKMFNQTIERFHDLSLRYQQFEHALQQTTEERKINASDVISNCHSFNWLVKAYQHHIESGVLQCRIFHNDTKINNILFDEKSGKAVCVIDLDTLMPGYFIYDAGDMIRTYVSPVTEEESDLNNIVFRTEMYEALKQGYLEEMGTYLSKEERVLFPFSGMMMTYIMALRMAADYLNGNIYYQVTHEEQNLVRARNQLHWLSIQEKEFRIH
jgi:Ser/Thr protein kinase RdoA (MazF antagonist)